ncbi:MAG: trypsin-like serine peptidase, partial [Pseudobdellovibrionaceae bacterium]
MKAFVLIASMMFAASVQASTCEDKNNLRIIASTAAEIKDQTVKDERIVIDRTKGDFKDLNGIGVVTLPHQKGWGSGFLVSPCLVLTNLHVLYETKNSKTPRSDAEFSVGQTGSAKNPFSYPLIPGKVVAKGDYKGEEHGESSNSDWAVIKLSKSVGNSVGYIKLYQMSLEAMGNRPVITAGFPADKSEEGKDVSQLYGDNKCKILGFSVFSYIFHTCQTTPGQSGSPLLTQSPKDGKFYAIGMVDGVAPGSTGMARSVDPDKANIAVAFDSGKEFGVVSDGDKIVAAIKANKCD